MGHREPQSPLRKKSINALQHRPTSPTLTPNRSPHAPTPPTSPCHPMSPHPHVPPLPHTLPSPAQHSDPAGCGPYPKSSHVPTHPSPQCPPRHFHPHLCPTPLPALHSPLWGRYTRPENVLEELWGSGCVCGGETGGYKHMGGYGHTACRSRMLFGRRQDVGCRWDTGVSGLRGHSGNGAMWGEVRGKEGGAGQCWSAFISS